MNQTAPPPAMPPFESTARHAKQTGDYGPVWATFVNTAFFVLVLVVDDNDEKTEFELAVFESGDGPVIHITESMEGHQLADNQSAIRLLGGELVRMVDSNVGIAVVMSDEAFCLSKDTVQWLKSCLVPLSPSGNTEDQPLH